MALLAVALLLVLTTFTAAEKVTGVGGVFSNAVGPCIDDKCPPSNSCYYGQCIPSEIAPKMPKPDKAPVADCEEGGFCQPGTYCHKGKCYSYC